MRKTTRKPPLAAVPPEAEDPIWGKTLADFFGMGNIFTDRPAAPPAREETPAPTKPGRKAPKVKTG
jgi:hypothetical protein